MPTKNRLGKGQKIRWSNQAWSKVLVLKVFSEPRQPVCSARAGSNPVSTIFIFDFRYMLLDYSFNLTLIFHFFSDCFLLVLTIFWMVLPVVFSSWMRLAHGHILYLLIVLNPACSIQRV